ncbi:reprolysin-like metallopeptidase [Pseudomonas syringae]|uniref:reprolysin-like metallopeptidase n=1 Tax=Pseudomonas syringae TaxID=317 RepID=UPI003F76EB7C
MKNALAKNTLKTWLSLAVFFYLPFATASGPNLGLFLVMHDQLTQQERNDLNESYLSPLVKQLTEITGRRVTVTLITNEPGTTDFDYRGLEKTELLTSLSLISEKYADAKNLPLPSKRHKYVFLTSNKISLMRHGVTATNYNVAIASLKRYHTLAHEVGHLFGATHEAATGFPCQTTMWGDFTTAIIPCYYFSEANKALIRNYVNGTPAVN